MRFLILTQYFPPEIGAPQTRLAAVAGELVRLGHEVEVVTAMPNHLVGRVYEGYRGRFYVREHWRGIPVHRTWVYASMGTGFPRLLNYLSFCFSSLFALIRIRKPDVVFVESPPLFLAFPGWLAARRAKAKLVFNVADLWPDAVADFGVLREGTMLRLAGHLEAWAYRSASYVNAVTEGIAERLRDGKDVAPGKILYLPNGVDTKVLRPQEADHQLAQRLGLTGKTVFLYAGTHGIVHGLEHVVRAAKLVEKDNIAVVFLGAGTMKAALIELARTLDAKNVVFHDPIPLERTPAFYSIACASIVTVVRSRHAKGARPSKMFSSLACAVPVLYSGEGEGAEIVRAAHAGVVVEPEDAEALARAMIELRNRPDLRARMSQNARRTAEGQFSWKRIVEEWVENLQTRRIG